MRRAVVVGSGCDAAYPDRLPVTGHKLRIVYKKLVAVKRNALDYVFVKRNIRGIKPIDRDAALERKPGAAVRLISVIKRRVKRVKSARSRPSLQPVSLTL